MRVISRGVLNSALMLAIAAAAVARATEVTTLRAGEGNGANVIFVFDENVKPPVIVLRTAQLGVAGSRIEITVDKIRKPVFHHVFDPEECKFGDRGSACEVTISANDQAYRTIHALFKRGHLARVSVRDAGVKETDQTVPLGGFAKAQR
jgi:hypothetical protein